MTVTIEPGVSQQLSTTLLYSTNNDYTVPLLTENNEPTSKNEIKAAFQNLTYSNPCCVKIARNMKYCNNSSNTILVNLFNRNLHHHNINLYITRPCSIHRKLPSNCIKKKKPSSADTTYRSFASNNNSQKEMTPNTLAIARSLLAKVGDDDSNNERLNKRRALSKAITLIESRSMDHIQQGDLLLNYLIEENLRAAKSKKEGCDGYNGERKNFRVGIAGAPGAGMKS